jgi:hypothetical protein
LIEGRPPSNATPRPSARADRARRTLRGIDEQIAKAERAVAGKVPVKRNRFIRLVGADKSVNRALEAKARALAGWKGYTTNLAVCPDGTPVTPQFVIEAYHHRAALPHRRDPRRSTAHHRSRPRPRRRVRRRRLRASPRSARRPPRSLRCGGPMQTFVLSRRPRVSARVQTAARC